MNPSGAEANGLRGIDLLLFTYAVGDWTGPLRDEWKGSGQGS